jgi:hypothetical protein
VDLADRLGRPARQIDSLQLTLPEECDGLAVRGPEWQPGVFPSGEHPRGRAVQRLDPKSGLPVVRRDIGRSLAVRRQRDAGSLGSKRKLGAFGRIDLETQDAFIGGRLPEVRRRPNTQGAQRQRHCGRDPPSPGQIRPGGRKFHVGRWRKRRSAQTAGDRHGLPPHGSYESIAAARHGFDVSRILGRIAQSASQLIHRGVEAVLEIDERPFLPDPLTQLVVCNHIPGMRQQGQQDLKRLAGQTNTYSALEQLPRWNIHFKGSEGQPSGRLGLRKHRKCVAIVYHGPGD